jgi:hypothetical protein
VRISKLPPNLTAVLAHVDAARAVYEYLHGGGFEKDAHRLQELLREEAQARFRFLKEWKFEQVSDVDAHWHPENWEVLRGDCIAIGITTPKPVDDDSDPYAYLYVPENWRKGRVLEDRLLARKNRRYEHSRDAKNCDRYERSWPVWVYVPYKDFVRRGGSYDCGRFVAALVKALGVVLDLRHEVDAVVQERRTRSDAVAK